MVHKISHIIRFKHTFRLPLLLCLVALAGMLGSCVKNEFRMIFSLPESVNTTYRLTYYASDPRGGVQIESAVAVAAGKADVMGITRYPTLVTLFSGASDLPAAIFYAERGDKITLTGTDSDPVKWEISGNDINKELTRWRLENSAAIEAARKVREGDSDLAPRKKLNSIVAKYVEAHADSRVAPLLLFSYFDASAQPEEFVKLCLSLEKTGASDQFVGLLTRHDISTASSPAEDVRKLQLKDMVVQSHAHNIDTLQFASGSVPVLLYYWRKDDPTHKEITDTLKALVKWRADSASMTLADVALMADSTQWAAAMRRDSLKGCVRAFSPRGLADADAMRLGVRSTPWFVVGSGKGKAVYSGNDAAEAARSFRALRKKDKK